MTAVAPNSRIRPSCTADDSIKSSLKLLAGMLDEGTDRLFDADYNDALGKELRRLHARLRVHHAADQLGTGLGDELSPELTGEVERLRAEHPVILGNLDRLIRSVESVADRSIEDKEVLLLRGHELIALLRRHEAEEDRLFYLSVWRDIGGEG